MYIHVDHSCSGPMNKLCQTHSPRLQSKELGRAAPRAPLLSGLHVVHAQPQQALARQGAEFSENMGRVAEGSNKIVQLAVAVIAVVAVVVVVEVVAIVLVLD